MSKVISFSLYFTSFLPLWVSVLFLDIKSCIEYQDHLWTERISITVIVVLSLVSLIVIMFYFKANSKNVSTEYVIKSVSEDKTITAEYLLSYILPLFAFDFTQWSQVVLFLNFFITLGFLCVRHNYFSVNLMLELINYKVYSCKLENEDRVTIECKVISHRILNSFIGESIFVKSINNEMKLDIEQ